MITKNELKYYQSLLQKKVRKEEKKFIVEGKRIVEEGLKSKFKCEIIFLTSSFRDNNNHLIEQFKNDARIEILGVKDFDKLSETKHSQGIAAVFQKNPTNESLLETSQLIVALENISDPGNAGTIIRNCDWFGIKGIIWGENCAELYNPKVLRASMGSVFHLNISESHNLASLLTELSKKGYSILSSDLEGENIFNYKSAIKSIIIFSNEADGPSKDILNIADRRINIPKLGNAESLNVASASAIILAELTKLK